MVRWFSNESRSSESIDVIFKRQLTAAFFLYSHYLISHINKPQQQKFAVSEVKLSMRTGISDGQSQGFLNSPGCLIINLVKWVKRLSGVEMQ